MKTPTRRTSRRSASSLKEPRSKTMPKERLNRPALLDKGQQRKAPLARLPEHLPRLKQHHHRLRRACGSTTRKAPSPEVLTKIDSTLENGRNGMGAGTKRSSDTAALNGSRDRVEWHLAQTIGLCIYSLAALLLSVFSGLQRVGAVRQTEMVSPW